MSRCLRQLHETTSLPLTMLEYCLAPSKIDWPNDGDYGRGKVVNGEIAETAPLRLETHAIFESEAAASKEPKIPTSLQKMFSLLLPN